jgi:putative hydrolase of the HAD superfamily
LQVVQERESGQYRGAWRCYDDVAGFLRATGSHKKIAVTNGDRRQQREKMEATGLLAHIPDLVAPEDAGAWKPDHGIFLHALRLLDVRPDEAMMIGDDYERDIVPAAAVGLRTFWVRRECYGLNDALTVLNGE